MSNKLPLRWIIHFHLVGRARGGEISVVFWKLSEDSFVVNETYMKATETRNSFTKLFYDAVQFRYEKQIEISLPIFRKKGLVWNDSFQNVHFLANGSFN